MNNMLCINSVLQLYLQYIGKYWNIYNLSLIYNFNLPACQVTLLVTTENITNYFESNAEYSMQPT